MYEGVRLLGEITENRETFFPEVVDSYNGDVTSRLHQAIKYKFSENILVILDYVAYITANKVIEFVDNLGSKVTHLQTGSHDMNPVEEYWIQL